MLTGNGVRKECRSKESESNGGLCLGNPVGMVMMMAVVMVMMAEVVAAAARNNLPAANLDGLGHTLSALLDHRSEDCFSQMLNQIEIQRHFRHARW